ncbi:signal peptide peptidase SppA [Alkalicoccus chagannorensis]
MNGKRWAALAAAAAVVLVSGIINLATTALQTDFTEVFEGGTDPVNERVVEEGTDAGKIAVIPIEGTIMAGGAGLLGGGYDHQLLLRQLEQAAEDPEVSGVVLRVNTPGGGVVESDEIHNSIQNLQEEYSKDVYVSMGNQAASGGYYVSAPADRIFANGQTITGSLGVIMQSINVAELADDLGISDNTIQSGEFKDIMSPTREMTDEDEEVLQSIVDDAYEQFVDVIDEGRENLSREEILELADGRIYTGSQAVDNGLVDDTGNLDDAVDAMKEDLGQDYSVVEYEAGFGIGSLMGAAAETFASQSQKDQLLDWVTSNQGRELMYLYTD